MPHPLPDDVNSVTGLKWFLAAVPDDPAFTRAAWDIFTEMGNYWKWGKEGPVPGDSDKAAQLWTNAIYETIEAYKMGFPDILLGHIDEVEDLLRGLQVSDEYRIILDQLCCGDGVVAPIGDTTGGDIVRDVGDPPGEIETWPDYDVRLCSAAQKFVDSLPNWVTVLQGLSVLTTVGLAAVLGGLVAGLAGAGIAIAGALGIQEALQLLDDVLALFDTGPTWQDARDSLENSTVKEELVCAIVNANNPASAEAAIDTYLDSIDSDAAAAVRTLPLRFMMNKIFNAESDSAGYGGPCGCTGDETSLFAQGADLVKYPATWVNDVGPWLSTVTEYSILTSNYDEVSAGYNYQVMFFDDAAPNNAKYAPTSWRFKLTGWAASGYSEGIDYFTTNETLTAGPATAVIQNGVWYYPPAGTYRALVRTAKSPMTLTFEVLEI